MVAVPQEDYARILLENSEARTILRGIVYGWDNQADDHGQLLHEAVQMAKKYLESIEVPVWNGKDPPRRANAYKLSR